MRATIGPPFETLGTEARPSTEQRRRRAAAAHGFNGIHPDSE
jgi:hypothetical protein